MYDCVTYGVMMSHVGEDIAAVMGDEPTLKKWDRDGANVARAALYVVGNRRLVCPVQYTAATCTFSLDNKDQKIILNTGTLMAKLVVTQPMCAPLQF